MGKKYFPSTTDKELPSGKFRGAVQKLSPDGWERVAYVYGDTLEEMRRRKHLIAEALNDTKP